MVSERNKRGGEQKRKGKDCNTVFDRLFYVELARCIEGLARCIEFLFA
jgi:hypothetical protein